MTATLFPRSRKGDWPQIFLILFFVFLVILSIALLTMESKRLKDSRPQLATDLNDQRENAMLISLLRTTTADGNIADLIIMNEAGDKTSYDDKLRAAIDGTLGKSDVIYNLVITYPTGEGIIARNFDVTSQNYRGILGSIPLTINDVTTYLPGKNGNIQVTFSAVQMADVRARASEPLISGKTPKELEGTYMHTTGGKVSE